MTRVGLIQSDTKRYLGKLANRRLLIRMGGCIVYAAHFFTAGGE
jgi:hypothetical protein